MSILDTQAPAILYVGETEKNMNFDKWGKEMILKAIPVYSYAKGYPQTAMEHQDQELMHQLILSEGRDEHYVPAREQEPVLDKSTSGNELVERESIEAKENMEAKRNMEEKDEGSFSQLPNIDMKTAQPLSELTDFEVLKSKYYVMDSTTTIDASQLNLENLLAYDMRIERREDLPQILIYHTHSQEGFVGSDYGDPSTTIVGAGELLAQYLRNFGFNVIHDTGTYDVENRDYAYS
ncbi:MAG: stage II sporulation protein P, partial [Lachnospiraceae bacterium]|nr:stage II sporulation protein P [Lachnospiraceae bacterium]